MLKSHSQEKPQELSLSVQIETMFGVLVICVVLLFFYQQCIVGVSDSLLSKISALESKVSDQAEVITHLSIELNNVRRNQAAE